MLKGLIASLLHLDPDEIKSIEIRNPIDLEIHLYSDKLTLCVVNLKETALATEEDKAYNIDYWARLFKAKTWEDLKMLAENNEYLKEAADSLYQANADDIVLEQCRAREEAERRERTLERDNRLLTEENEKLQQDNANLQQDNANLRERIAELEGMIAK